MLPALLAAITLAAYANSFGLGLATDARVIVTADSRIRDLTPENLILIFSTDYWWPTPVDVLYRPVTILSYLFNYAVLGDRDGPAGYHALNFVLHTINVLLLFALCRKLLGKDAPAFFAAALWAVHPVGTESVANVSGRADLLAASGALGALVVYNRARELNCRRAAFWAAGVFSLTAFSFLSKESGAVIPGLMLLWDSLDLAALRANWKRRGLFYGAAAAALALVFWMRYQILAARPWPRLQYVDNPLLMSDFWTARFTAIKVLGLQLWLMLCPLRLAFDRSYREIAAATPGDPLVWCALIAVLGILSAALIRYRRDRVIYFAVGLAAICILPTSNLIVLIGSILAERFLYLPSIGFAIAAVALLFRLKEERTARIVLTVALVVFAGRTFVRNFDWRDNLALMSADVNTSPGSFRTHDLLGRELDIQNPHANLDRAIREGEAAWQILRDLPPLYIPDGTPRHLGLYYATKGDDAGGVASEHGRGWFQKALDVLLRARQASEAGEREFDRQQLAHGRPLAKRQGSPDVYQTLGAVYSRFGRHQEAIEALRYGRGLKPEGSEFYAALSVEYLAAGAASMSAAVALERIFLEGARAESMYALREASAKMPGGECALSESRGIVSPNFACPAVRQQTCVALYDLAEGFTEARQPARAREQRDRAAGQFGCAGRP